MRLRRERVSVAVARVVCVPFEYRCASCPIYHCVQCGMARLVGPSVCHDVRAGGVWGVRGREDLFFGRSTCGV